MAAVREKSSAFEHSVQAIGRLMWAESVPLDGVIGTGPVPAALLSHQFH
jgi:hypothetical protein